MAAEKILEIRDLVLSFGGLKALNGVDLHVHDKEILAVIGPNGAGKTTTLKAISGVLRTELGEVTDGSIEFEDKRIDRMNPEEIVRLGVVQVMEGRRLFEHLTVEENLLVGAYLRTNKAEVRRDLEKAYDYFPRLKELRRRTSGTCRAVSVKCS
jgi:branched-chain amino acid transport system ATP-binding protein